MILFTYGSLRRDASGRHHPLLRLTRFVGSAHVHGRLYRVSWHPGLHLSPEAGAVVGDLFRVPEAGGTDILDALHEYEGPHFRLVPVVASLPDGGTVHAHTWVWLGDADSATWLPSGDWGPAADHAPG